MAMEGLGNCDHNFNVQRTLLALTSGLRSPSVMQHIVSVETSSSILHSIKT